MDSVRSYPPIWYFRLAQALVALIILAITGSTASDWHHIGCSTPTRLGYNISCAALTLPLVLYFIFSSGPIASLRKLPWSRWVQLGLDALFFILWLASAGVSNYNCNGLCSSCSEAGRALDNGDEFYVWVGSLFCNCYFPDSNSQDLNNEKRNLYRRAGSYRPGGNTRGAGLTKSGFKASKLAAKKGFDAVMVLLFFITLVTTAFVIYKNRNGKADVPAAHRADNQQANNPEAGMGIPNQ